MNHSTWRGLALGLVMAVGASGLAAEGTVPIFVLARGASARKWDCPPRVTQESGQPPAERKNADKPAPNQDQVVAEIRKLGGEVTVAEGRPQRPVVGVRLGDTKITDAGLALLRQLPQLQDLDLTYTGISDAGLAHLRGLPLRSLDLEGAGITDAGLEHLRQLKRLEVLGLCGTKVTDAGLNRLKGMTQLRVLELGSTAVTKAGAAELQKSLPGTQILLKEIP